MSLKNKLLTTLVHLLQRFFPPPKPIEDRFLILSTTGLGDTLWATPALHALRTAYPTHYIGVVTSPIGFSLLEHNPHLTELFIVKDPVFFQLFSLYRTLKKRRISHVLSFHTSQRAILPLAAGIGAHTIVATEGLNKGLDALLTCAVPSRPCHEIQRRLELVQAVGASSTTSEMQLFLTQKDTSFSIPTLRPLIGIHPGAKDRFKQWPKEHFIQLGRKLQQTQHCQIVVTGAPSEKKLVEFIATRIPGAVAATDLTICQIAALIDQLSLLITNDTGPMHLSFAMKTPTVALFTPTDPLLCGPHLFNQCIVIAKKPTCRPCIKKKCQFAFCLLQIGVQEVYDAAIDLLKTLHPQEVHFD